MVYGRLSLSRDLSLERDYWYLLKWGDAGAGAKFDEIERFFRQLYKIGPLFGYYPEPTKSILIMRQHNLEAARLQFPDFKVRTQGFATLEASSAKILTLGNGSGRKLEIGKRPSRT